MFYSKTNIQRTLPQYVGCLLCWWHSYKMACEKIYHAFLPTIIAPIVVNTFPGVNIKKKPTLGSTAVTLITFRLAFDAIKDDVDGALDNDDTLTAAQRAHFHYMKDLCEFFIPAVLHFLS